MLGFYIIIMVIATMVLVIINAQLISTLNNKRIKKILNIAITVALSAILIIGYFVLR